MTAQEICDLANIAYNVIYYIDQYNEEFYSKLGEHAHKYVNESDEEFYDALMRIRHEVTGEAPISYMFIDNKNCFHRFKKLVKYRVQLEEILKDVQG